MKQAAQILLYNNAVIWVGFAAWTILRLATRSSSQQAGYMVIALLMLGNAGAFLLAGLGLSKPNRLSWLFAMAVLAVNIVLTFTDEVGALDLITAALDIIIVGLLIATRKQFWQADLKLSTHNR